MAPNSSGQISSKFYTFRFFPIWIYLLISIEICYKTEFISIYSIYLLLGSCLYSDSFGKGPLMNNLRCLTDFVRDITDNVTLDGITTKIKWKLHALLTLHVSNFEGCLYMPHHDCPNSVSCHFWGFSIKSCPEWLQVEAFPNLE